MGQQPSQQIDNRHILNEQVIKVIKIAVIGSSGVGKSTAMARYIYCKRLEELNKEYLDQMYKKPGIYNETYCYLLTIYEMAHTQNSIYQLSEFDGIIVMFALDSVESFQQCINIFKSIKRIQNKNFPFPTLLVGNRFDEISRKVAKKEAKQLVEGNNSKYIEISAIYGVNVDLAFYMIVDRIFEVKMPKLWVEGKTIKFDQYQNEYSKIFMREMSKKLKQISEIVRKTKEDYQILKEFVGKLHYMFQKLVAGQ